ncbi:MAG: hypothetical protein MZV64_69475 [Ignavibacteriales bacterium]|nr:hypothetical protein [Ignavibacteriales bacterium]
MFFFQCSTRTYPSNYYVDGDLTTGSNDGTTWANAWQSLSAINWSSIDPGDVIYISGGTDSTFYYEQLNIGATGSPDNLITIRAGLDVGHNGRVIIDAEGTRNHAVLVYGGNSQGYLRIVKLEGRRSTGQGTFGILSGDAGTSQNINVVYIDSCKMTDILGHGGYL